MNCCAKCRSRHKRLVDAIFPANPEDGLVKNKMENLTFYVIRKPEKLKLVGEYLFDWLDFSIERLRAKRGYAKVCLEAIDHLLVACRAQTLNLFVESFLNMIQLVLEKCPDYDLQVLAIISFTKFTNIEEDAPTYHISYDFFISKFNSMCFCRADNEAIQNRVRIAGMRGLQGVVKKTFSDGIQVNIWQKAHMEKIVPSYLFNMSVQDPGLTVNLSDLILTADHSPEMVNAVAEACFRELLCRLTSANVDTVFVPVLNYFDDHRCWAPNHFAAKVVRTIITSAQMQCSWEILRALLKHLDTHEASQPRVLTGITDVLRQAVNVVDTHFFGMTFYEVFSCLVQHLRTSVVRQYSRGPNRAGSPATVDEERAFQEAIINTIVEVANSQQQHQDQLNEIISFLIGFAVLPLPPVPSSGLNALPPSASMARLSAVQRQQQDERMAADAMCAVQRILLRAVLRIAQKYKTVSLGSALSSSVLEALIRLVQADDRVVRYVVQRIFNHLIDRHGNQSRLETVELVESLDSCPGFVVGEPSDADSLFAAKNGSLLLYAVYTAATFESNHVDNVAALYSTIALLSLELPLGDFLLTVCALCLAIQSLATLGYASVDSDGDDESGVASLPKIKLTFTNGSQQLHAEGQKSESSEPTLSNAPSNNALSPNGAPSRSLLPMPHRCALHAVVAAIFSLVACLLPVDSFSAAVRAVIEARRKQAPFLLPAMAFSRTNSSEIYPPSLPPSDSLYFNREEMTSLLDAAGYRPHDLMLSAPQTRALLFASGNRHLLEGTRSLSASELSLASTTGTSESAGGFLSINRPGEFDSESLPPMEDLSAESIRSILRPPVVDQNGLSSAKHLSASSNRQQSNQHQRETAPITGILRQSVDQPPSSKNSTPTTLRRNAEGSTPNTASANHQHHHHQHHHHHHHHNNHGRSLHHRHSTSVSKSGTQQGQQQNASDLYATLTDLVESYSSHQVPPPLNLAGNGRLEDGVGDTGSGSDDDPDSPRMAFLSNGIPLTEIKFPEEFLYPGGSIA